MNTRCIYRHCLLTIVQELTATQTSSQRNLQLYETY